MWNHVRGAGTSPVGECKRQIFGDRSDPIDVSEKKDVVQRVSKIEADNRPAEIMGNTATPASELKGNMF